MNISKKYTQFVQSEPLVSPIRAKAAKLRRNNGPEVKNRSIFKAEVVSRALYLADVVASPIVSLFNLTLGLAESVPGLVGMVPFCGDAITPLRQKSFKLLTAGSGGLLAAPFYSLVQFINPDAKVEVSKEEELTLTDSLWGRMEPLAEKLQNKGGLSKHVVSRLVYVGLGIASVITRVFDLVVGILAGSLALLSGGQFEELNSIAFKSLGVGAVIKDIYYCALKIINPSINLKSRIPQPLLIRKAV